MQHSSENVSGLERAERDKHGAGWIEGTGKAAEMEDVEKYCGVL